MPRPVRFWPLVLVLAALLTACGDDDPPSADTPVTEADADTTEGGDAGTQAEEEQESEDAVSPPDAECPTPEEVSAGVGLEVRVDDTGSDLPPAQNVLSCHYTTVTQPPDIAYSFYIGNATDHDGADPDLACQEPAGATVVWSEHDIADTHCTTGSIWEQDESEYLGAHQGYANAMALGSGDYVCFASVVHIQGLDEPEPQPEHFTAANQYFGDLTRATCQG